MKNLVFIMLVVLFSGCGFEHDPYANRSDKVKDAEERTSEQDITLDRAMLIIADDVFTFKEGLKSTFTIKSRVLPMGIIKSDTKHELRVQMGSLSKAKTQPDYNQLTGEFTWTPPKDFVNNEKTKIESTTIKVMLVVHTKPKIVKTKEIRIDVQTEFNIPKITSIKNFPSVLEEGQSKHFEIYVEDLDSETNPPALAFLASKNGIRSAANNVKMHRSEFNKRLSLWVFDLSIEFDDKVYQGQSESVNYSLDFRAFSSNNIPSDTISKTVELRLIPKDPIGVLETYYDIYKGQTNRVYFSFYAPLQRGRLSVSNVTADFSSWPSSPTLNCKSVDDAAGMKSCTLTWKVPSSGFRNSVYKLALRVKNSNGSRTATKDFNTKLYIEEAK